MVLPIRQFYLGLAHHGFCQAALHRVCKPQVEGSFPLASSWIIDYGSCVLHLRSKRIGAIPWGGLYAVADSFETGTNLAPSLNSCMSSVGCHLISDTPSAGVRYGCFRPHYPDRHLTSLVLHFMLLEFQPRPFTRSHKSSREISQVTRYRRLPISPHLILSR